MTDDEQIANLRDRIEDHTQRMNALPKDAPFRVKLVDAVIADQATLIELLTKDHSP